MAMIMMTTMHTVYKMQQALGYKGSFVVANEHWSDLVICDQI